MAVLRDVIIKCPIRLIKELEELTGVIYRASKMIYTETTDYDLYGVKIGIIPVGLVAISEDKPKELQQYIKEQVYENLLNKVHQLEEIDPIEKSYLIEACECAKSGHRLAAATMIGCAAENLLIRFTEAFYLYLKNNNASEVELQNYEKKVFKAPKASNRLSEFIKYVAPHKKIIEAFGLENP